MVRIWTTFAACLALAGCSGLELQQGSAERAAQLDGPPLRCVEATPRLPLPAQVRESSGAVRAYPHLRLEEAGFWTHNDSGWPGVLFRVGMDGRLLDQVRLEGIDPIDWEDMGAGPCPGGGRCLYLADTGDNRELRPEVRIHRTPEPLPGDTLVPRARISEVRVRLPQGPRDVEAMVVLEHESILLITKGRNHPVEVYLLPGPLIQEDAEPRVPTLIQQLTSRPASGGELVVGGTTGAASLMHPDGRAEGMVAVRSYQDLHFFGVGPDLSAGLRPIAGGRVNLRPLREAQGEAVAFLGDGLVLVTSEAGFRAPVGSFQVLDCSISLHH